jgi:Sulfotransferase domain
MLTDVLGVPNWGYWVPGEVAWDQLPPAASIAMHWRYSAAFEGFVRERGFRIVVTARHPLDVLISILQYAPTDPTTNRWLEGEAGDERRLTADVTPVGDAFVRYALGWRAEALLEVSVRWAARSDALMRYADLVRDPAGEIELVLRTLGLAGVNDVAEAVRKHSPAHTAQRTPGHYWQGTPDLWKRLIVPEVALAIAQRHPAAFSAFGFACDPDPELTAAQAEANWHALTANRAAKSATSG